MHTINYEESCVIPNLLMKKELYPFYSMEVLRILDSNSQFGTGISYARPISFFFTQVFSTPAKTKINSPISITKGSKMASHQKLSLATALDL